MSEKRAFITGITGQDGSYLTELLLTKGYIVHGLIRRSSSFNTDRIDHIYRDPHNQDVRLFLHYGDLSDATNLNRLLRQIKPHEIYHLGAQSHVKVSFDMPEFTADVTGVGTVRILDAILDSGIETRFYQASSSEMFGKVQEIPQRESTPFYPRSPYGCAKVFAYWLTVNYREAYKMFACNGILFNHESPRRGETFVTRKITRGLSKILAGKQKEIYLGNLDAKRDWGHAKDYVEAMWMMLQQPKPDDFVIATGETHTVREFLDTAFALVGRNWQEYVKIDPKYYRPTEVDMLIGDATKAREVLKWKPKTTFKELVHEMVISDLKLDNLNPRDFIKSRPSETRHELEL